jgi:GNAT superfamily N-acetyltransferase
MRESLIPPAKLQPAHDVSEFDCGAEELTFWLKRWAWVNQRAGNASVYVACRGERVVGYYALAAAGVEKELAPSEIKKGGAPKQVPCLLLARLAVDKNEHGAGIGKGLLVDALKRAVRGADEFGIRALLIHARDETARDWYTHQAEFVPSPTDPLHLFLHLKQVRRLLQG